MAITIDFAASIISIPQADLTLISGALYELETEDKFRADVNALMDDETGIVFDDPILHNTEVTVAGTTFARTIEIINGYSITFENLVYSVRLAQSNNNIFDVESGILNPSGNVTVIAQNSAGLISAPEITTVRKLMENRQRANASTNKLEVFDDADSVIEFEADIFKDLGITAWDGSGDIIQRDQFVKV